MMDDNRQPIPESPEQPANEAAAEPSKRTTRAEIPAPAVKLETYEGPLDLLLDLIRKQQINIYDIPIAKITKQYLDYLRLMEELNIDVAGEFILMAATLIYIKSRMLLPPDPTAPEEEQQEDPRAELVQRLLEHEQFKNAAEMLKSKRTVEEATWSNPGISEFTEAEDEPGLAVSAFDLISAFREILERAKKRPQVQIRREQVTVQEMLEHVKQVMRERSGPVTIEELVAGYVWRQALIALLLALLELVRLRAIHLRQEDLFAPITVVKSKRFDEIVDSINAADLEESLGEI
ncbi:MAG TPA: segregation/condensation protein A [Terriglobia bacterium]|nr:segregation/condensation protein A [Terriglobia bacterium]